MNVSSNKIFLHPGGLHFSRGREQIYTLLGSCVSITLWHPQRHFGGMCHFVLPENPSKRNDADALDCRYADDVIKMFGILARRHGTALCDYEAKIFGGGNMIRSADQNTENSIGTRNSVAAMQLLMQANVNILVAHVGEFGHRRIIFDTGNGEVWVKYIESGKARPDGKGGIL